MWLENVRLNNRPESLLRVSILLLLDVAGKLDDPQFQFPRFDRFNPSSSGCGWKTRGCSVVSPGA